MDIPKLDPKLNLPIIIGVSIFVSEFLLGWLSFILVVIPMIFVLALVVGFFVDSISDSIVAFAIVLVIGNLIGGLILAAVLFPAWLGPGRIELDALGVLFFIAPFLAMSGATTLLNGFTLTEYTLIMFIIAPGLYFFSFGFAAIGSKLRIWLRNEQSEIEETTESVVL